MVIYIFNEIASLFINLFHGIDCKYKTSIDDHFCKIKNLAHFYSNFINNNIFQQIIMHIYR